jgi:hypothetical protein
VVVMLGRVIVSHEEWRAKRVAHLRTPRVNEVTKSSGDHKVTQLLWVAVVNKTL